MYILTNNFSIILAHCIPQDAGYSHRGTTTQPFQQTKSKFKPNSLPVLNCLFAGIYYSKISWKLMKTEYVFQYSIRIFSSNQNKIKNTIMFCLFF